MALLTKLRALLQRRRVARELDDELAFHVEMETRAHVARGVPPDEARRRALADFGGVVQTKEAVRDVRAFAIESIWQDVRYAVRTLRGAPGFTLAAAGMLALGIGITTAMFTVIDALVLRPVPFHDPARIAQLSLWTGPDRDRDVVLPAVLQAWRDSPAFEAAESVLSDTALLEIGDTLVTSGIGHVTPGVFDLLGGVGALRGRLFDPTEGSPGLRDRVIISETLWRSLYGADPELVGRPITVDGERLIVVGVLPASFRFPSSSIELWRPTDRPQRTAGIYVRFAPDVPRDDALRIAADAARAAGADSDDARLQVSSLAGGLRDAYSNRAVPLLAGAVVLVFLVLCANVCGLLLARLTRRRGEFSVRAALGAPRHRLMRQAFVESALLGALGAALGAGVAWLLVAVARALIPPALLAQTLNPLGLDERAFAATSLAGLVATLATGLLPAWLGTRVDAGESLSAVDRRGTETRGTRTLARGLLIAEVALACTLLAGATLLARSFVNLASADRGLDTTGVTVLWLDVRAAAASNDAAALAAIARTIEDELRRLPGLQHLAWSYGWPPGAGFHDERAWISDLPGASPVTMLVGHYVVSPEFFSLYRIPILRGRNFVPSEEFTDVMLPESKAFPDVIVSERFARALWQYADPVGRIVRFDGGQYRIIGLARDIHYPSISDPGGLDSPALYHRYTHGPLTPMISLRCEPACDAAVIRHRLASAHPTVRVTWARTPDADYAAALVRPRAAAALALAFAGVALLAAAGGLFSLLSYAVARRRQEFGIRAALGASPAEIRRMVVRDGLTVAIAGLGAGSLFAVLLTRALSGLQYGVSAGDPVSLGIVVGTIGLTALAAAWQPARAAGRADPARLLREE